MMMPAEQDEIRQPYLPANRSVPDVVPLLDLGNRGRSRASDRDFGRNQALQRQQLGYGTASLGWRAGSLDDGRGM
jgi:hypothetical protein